MKKSKQMYRKPVLRQKFVVFDETHLLLGSGDYIGAGHERRDQNVNHLRRWRSILGWVFRGGKDYCPACAERLGFEPAGHAAKF